MTMVQPDLAYAIAYALGRLEHELDARLLYHSVAHTRDDVVPAVERLAARCGVHGEPLVLLRTAAYYHDMGFLVLREGHELVSAQIARTALPDFGYNAEQIAEIEGIILATRLPQSPRNLLEQILADADLDSLGRNDFMARNADLRAELEAFGSYADDPAWFANQLRFVADHCYWTSAARDLRDVQKQANLLALQRMVLA